MRHSSFIVTTLLAATLGSSALAADELQDRFFRQQRVIDDQLQQQRLSEAPLESLLDLQWGGWLEYYVFSYNDGVQKSRVVQRPGTSFWTRLRLDNGAHEIFARVRLDYTHFRSGDEIERQEDWWGPNFDQAWYQVDVGRALRLNQPSDPLQMKLRIGRQTVTFGTGYALDMPLDAVFIDSKIYDFRVQGLIGKTIGSFPNIDRSEPVDSHSNRQLFGVQVQYEGCPKHVPFAYVYWNNDSTDERPKDIFQNYSYDSLYAGFGSRGEILHNLNYWAEGVFETGRSFANRAVFHRDDVQAYGWDLGLEKLFDVPTRPRVAAEYMFASGDADRLYSPTNAAGGNRYGTRDSSFVGFGFRDTGISLAPTMSNLHVWRLGGAFAPLEQIEFFHDLELGTNFFLYYKNQRHGAISDPLADQFEGYVGWEMDYFVNWRVASDVSWTMRWGTFFPGSAYTVDDTRYFLFTGLTWSF